MTTQNDRFAINSQLQHLQVRRLAVRGLLRDGGLLTPAPGQCDTPASASAAVRVVHW